MIEDKFPDSLIWKDEVGDGNCLPPIPTIF